jgi:phosphate starvation-inducible PhoH-like protein
MDDSSLRPAAQDGAPSPLPAGDATGVSTMEVDDLASERSERSHATAGSAEVASVPLQPTTVTSAAATNGEPAASPLLRDKIALDDNMASQMFYGQRNENLRRIEQETGADVHSRGNEVTLVGNGASVALARLLVEQLYALARRGRPLGPEDVTRAAKMLREDAGAELKDVFSDTVLVSSRARPITPKGLAQKRYIEAIRRDDIVFGIGPAGTGKTYLAMAMAVRQLMDKQKKRIVLCRPAVEAGEKLGFLPGSMEEKVNPYLRPLYDALHDMMDIDRASQLVQRGIIEVAPLAFMRGRTLNDAFVILDEAQNTTSEQMKMFLTRLGFESKAVITGDVTQVDLPAGMRSGLLEARDLLKDIPGISMCTFTEVDVVRHPLVQEIIRAYDRRAREKALEKLSQKQEHKEKGPTGGGP